MPIREWLKLLRFPRAGEERDANVNAFAGEGEDELDPFNPFPDPVKLEIGDVIDLHTIPPSDVKRVVEEYLREARRAGFRSVRIIWIGRKGGNFRICRDALLTDEL